MSVVAGIDFGTLSVRVSIMDSERGRLGSGSGEYPLQRKRDDPDYATQSHSSHMTALVSAMKKALGEAGVDGGEVTAIAVDTTGSSVIPVGEGLVPLDDYYLWCDHRAAAEAALITETARRSGLAAIEWCGVTYSSEWGFSKLLHWLRHNPDKRGRMVTALEHCDMAVATLCGISDPAAAPRSICAMGHKWMWNAALEGLPSEDFLASVDPLLRGTGTLGPRRGPEVRGQRGARASPRRAHLRDRGGPSDPAERPLGAIDGLAHTRRLPPDPHRPTERRLCGQPDVLEHRQEREHIRDLEGSTESRARTSKRRRRGDVDTVELDAAGC